MRFSSKHSPLLLLLLPSVAAGLASPAAAGAASAKEDTVAADATAAVTVKARHGLPTKDAPVDGKDGKPHLGPFVGSDTAATDAERQELPPLKGRPRDQTVIDGKKIPETNDGVMFDKNRERPQEGSRGTEGGVSEKVKARKDKESQTGEKVLTQPEAPKEQPPLPHSEEQKLWPSDDKDRDKDQGGNDYTGLGRPEDVPIPHREKTNALPKAANKDYVGTPKSRPDSAHAGNRATGAKEEDSIIQPLHSFFLSLAMILVSEVGDKTFLVAALMAMKHDRAVVFSAAFGALLVMTVLSACLGHAVPTLIPKRLTSLLAAGLFLVFGAKLLREGLKMDPNEGVSAEMQEVEQELAEKEKGRGRRRHNSLSPHSLEMGLGGRSSRPKGRIPSPPRSPSQSPSRSPSLKSRPLDNFLHGVGNLCSLLLSPAWVQTFAMTFLGEWGDRSQIATIAMAAGQDYWWVTLGATFGHAVCTGVAVVGGRAIAGRVSLKVVTVGGAIAFLLFALIYLIEALHS